jgi:pyruvate kinase
MARKTKVVCTLGPSCWGEEGLSSLMDAGMNVARFNFSHGDHAGHAEVLQRLRKVGRKCGVDGGWQERRLLFAACMRLLARHRCC